MTDTKTTPAEATLLQAAVFATIAAIIRPLSTIGAFAYNFAPVGGFAVFAGARVRSWLAFALPVAAMVAADVFMSIAISPDYSPLRWSQPPVYLAFLGYVALGRWLGPKGLLGIGAAACLGSLQFFLFTNFAYWLDPVSGYERSLTGLLHCYDAAIPFYRSTFLSDVVFSFAFVGVHMVWVRAAQAAPTATEAQ